MAEYVRVKKPFRQRLKTPLEGVVYQQATGPSLTNRVLDYYKAHPEEGRPSVEEVEEVIASLLLRGFLVQAPL